MENKYLAYVKAVGNYDGSATGGEIGRAHV